MNWHSGGVVIWRDPESTEWKRLTLPMPAEIEVLFYEHRDGAASEIGQKRLRSYLHCASHVLRPIDEEGGDLLVCDNCGVIVERNLSDFSPEWARIIRESRAGA